MNAEEAKALARKNTGKNIRKYREALGMSQEELANKCGFSGAYARSSISKIEKGQSDTTASRLKQIALALNVSPVDLLGSSETATEKRVSAYASKLAELFAQMDEADRAVMERMAESLLSAEKYKKGEAHEDA